MSSSWVFGKLKRFLSREPVFCAALALALTSSLFVPLSPAYLDYIDWRVLALLLGLMLLVACVQQHGLFDWLGARLTAHCRSLAALETTLVLLPFFSSMLITNDVALITFVPFALFLLGGLDQEPRAARLVTLQTIAANLGSMFTPIGNPQNLYLYSVSGLPLGGFLMLMLPLTALSLVLLLVFCLRGSREALPDRRDTQSPPPPDKWAMLRCAALFFLALGTVLHLVSWPVMLAVICAVLFFTDRQVFRGADYFLLGTFACFFVFVGNLQQVPAVHGLLTRLVQGRAFPVCLLASQFISNVPAAILLSGFTSDHTALLFGTNVGGLGTLIASLASLISYKFYAKAFPTRKGRYMVLFTLWNLLFLAILTPTAILLLTL